MFICRKTNKTGSISIQVIDKSRRHYRVIKSFGTGSTEVEIIRLEENARQYVREQTGKNWSLFEYEDEIRLIFISSISNSQMIIPVQFDALPLACLKLNCKTISFQNNDALYFYFRSPQSGFLSIFIDDNQFSQRLLPYHNMEAKYENGVTVEADKEYFFSAK